MMNPIWEILIRSGQVFTLIIGIFGLLFSFLLILAPEWVQRTSKRLDYWFNVDEKLFFLDRSFKTEGIIYRHHTIAGIMLVTGSAVFLLFLYFELDLQRFLDIFFKYSTTILIVEMILRAMIISGKLAGFAGLLVGLMLIFSLDHIMDIEGKMASGMTPQPLIDKLNAFNDGVDRMFLRYPVAFGLAGLAASIFLTLVSGTLLFMVS